MGLVPASQPPTADEESAEDRRERRKKEFAEFEREQRIALSPEDDGGTSPVEPGRTKEPSNSGELPADRRRDGLLWLWPLLIIATMAVLGHFLGSHAALIGGVAAVGVLVAVMSAGIVQRRTHALIGAVVCVVVVAVGFVFGRGLVDGDQRDEPARVRAEDGNAFTVEELRDGTVRGAILRDVVVDDLDLTRAELDGVVAFRASMRDTVLREAELAGADLHGGDLSNACLRGANLKGATLDRADFTGAVVTEASVDENAREITKNWGTPGAATCP